MASNDGKSASRSTRASRSASPYMRTGRIAGEALSALFYLGLEFAERQRTGLKEDVEDCQRERRDLKQMVDVLGPAALGTQRILVQLGGLDRGAAGVGGRAAGRGPADG
jgi:hypothetical protein